uniref:Uncharacterized protein n=1 Tax=Oryza sativa subsp. japonica TaxID=39947 RepID=Q84T81_ORYSJ|nr:hypothetical protein Os03g63610 [Oryza sativa Japonica Group]
MAIGPWLLTSSNVSADLQAPWQDDATKLLSPSVAHLPIFSNTQQRLEKEEVRRIASRPDVGTASLPDAGFHFLPAGSGAAKIVGCAASGSAQRNPQFADVFDLVIEEYSLRKAY